MLSGISYKKGDVGWWLISYTWQLAMTELHSCHIFNAVQVHLTL